MGAVSRLVEKIHGGPVERYRREMEPFERAALRAARARLLADMTGKILEIGAGLGQSFPYYSPGASVTAIEPAEPFRAVAELEAQYADLTIAVEDGDAHQLRYADAAFDGLFCSIVLCSLRDLTVALEEMHRVLRPGAPARFLEHVRSSNPGVAALQRTLDPLWAAFDGSGCSMTSHPIDPLRAAGFAIERLDRLRLPGPFGVLFPGLEIYARVKTGIGAG